MALADQTPVDSGFGRDTTGHDVLAGLDLSGRVAIVTGGASGIGLETTRALAARGARVIVAARSTAAAADALRGIDGAVEIAAMDLGDLRSVRNFATTVCGELPRLDLLINNAGIMACPASRVGPGWESQFAVNHLGHFALTQALMSLLTGTPGARVISLSSAAHKFSGIHWDDLQFENTAYDKWQAYGQSKTANALFANALSRRLRPGGGHAFSVHPGGIFTPLQRHLPREEMVMFGWIDGDGNPTEFARRGFKTPEAGCSTTLWAATSPLLEGRPGVYCEDCDIARPTDPDSPAARYAGVEEHACDDEAAERLWSVSEALAREA